MTENDIRNDLTTHNVTDNPFDVMMDMALELTRELLFACSRYKNPEVPDFLHTSEESLDSYVNKIKTEFSKLVDMSDDTVALCRETSYYRQHLDETNYTLLKFIEVLETVYNKSVPARNDNFEQIRLGKESDEYKRLLELRDIIDESEELSSVDDGYLYSLLDVISRPDDCVKYFMTKEEFDEKQKIVKKFNLTTDDVEYMISYSKCEWR